MTTALARRFKVDVSTDGDTWVNLKGIDDLNPAVNPTTEDTSDYDTDGWASSEITMLGWVLTIKALRKTNAGVFDPAQELVRKCVGEFGDAARIYVRWYDRNGADEAYQGWGIVTWAQSKTGVTDVEEVTITITGDGARTKITNPNTSASKPTILTASPSGASEGDQVSITGQYFTGTTAVKFGTAAASAYTVVSDGLIVAVMPSGSAGAANIVVTNATGASDAFSYTRAA